MTPKEIDIATLQWVIDEMKHDRENFIKWKTRNEAFIAAMDEMINTFECVIARVNRGEGLYPTSQLMG